MIQLLIDRGAGRKEREEARRVETPQSHTDEGVAVKDQELRAVKLEWTQTVEERRAHHKCNSGTIKDM